MHPFSVLTLGIFVAGYITARWDLVTRLCELAIFAWEYGVVVSPCRQVKLCGAQRTLLTWLLPLLLGARRKGSCRHHWPLLYRLRSGYSVVKKRNAPCMRNVTRSARV